MVVKVPGINAHEIGTKSMAYMLVILGTSALAMAMVQHWYSLKSLRARGLAKAPSLSFGVALLLTLMGGFAFSTLVMEL